MKKQISIVVVAGLLVGGVVGYRLLAEQERDHDHDHARAHDEHQESDHHDEVKLTPEAIRRHGVRVAAVTKQPLVPTFVAPGRVAFNAEAMAHVGSAVSGRVAEIKVRLGDTVKAGDELVIVESPEFGEAQSDYLQKRTALAVATSAVEPAWQAFERAEKLFEKNQGIALAEVQKRQTDYTTAQGGVQSAQGAVDAAGHKLRLMGLDDAAVKKLAESKQIDPRFVIRAPIAGQVVERETTLGERVSPDRETLLAIADLGTLWVIAEVSEARVPEVRLGSPAHVRLAVAGGAGPLDGKVSYISPSLDPGTRTAQVRIEVPNGSGALRPGMFARVELASVTDAAAEPVLAVPEQAIQTVEGKPSVFVPVAGEENTFAPRAVKLGRAVGGVVPVESGLKEGEPIVVNGSFILKADLGKAGAEGHSH
jgi:cobalt-zinc-cadmium efflux system membrane fusion protein